MIQGYPTKADIMAKLAALGIEECTEWSTDWVEEAWQKLYNLAMMAQWAIALRVYAASDTTINVVSGSYLYKGTVKTFTAGTAINPTDNDTTYVWMTPTNTIGSGINGSGWPVTEHIKLAEVDVDADGLITDIRDMRGQAFLSFAAIAGEPVGTSDSQTLTNKTIDGDSNTVQDLALTTLKTDLANASKFLQRDASGIPVNGKTVPAGDVIGSSDTQTLTNKTINAASNTLSNITGKELKTSSSDGAVSIILTATLTAGSTVTIFTAAAPYKFQIIDAWSIAKSADAGTWKITDGTNDITDAVAVTATDKTINRAGTIDDAYNIIAANGSLSVVGDGTLADVDVFISVIKVL